MVVNDIASCTATALDAGIRILIVLSAPGDRYNIRLTDSLGVAGGRPEGYDRQVVFRF
jgi:hypothetical protein